MDETLDAFLAAIDAIPVGYSEDLYQGRRYGITLSASADGNRRWLFAEELGGADRISCNLYLLPGRRAKVLPCEMPVEKVVAFVSGLGARHPNGPAEESPVKSDRTIFRTDSRDRPTNPNNDER